MNSIVVEREALIARPIEVVRAQFVDMQHHARAQVHPALEISNVRPQPGGCRFTARRRVFGLRQEDEFELAQHADGHSTLRSLSGANEGLRITQRFTALGSEHTRVHLQVEMPLRGALRLFAPLVRVGVEKDLAQAMEQDRADLEERGYGRGPESAAASGPPVQAH